MLMANHKITDNLDKRRIAPSAVIISINIIVIILLSG
jgi:hypothetical protein